MPSVMSFDPSSTNSIQNSGWGETQLSQVHDGSAKVNWGHLIHRVARSTFDEDKCRNVLVRYCAHIPRNYQYRDGIQQVFLVLREHMGDENLDLAGGVLYELIEIDCNFSDDPGAAFQRWRYDHMRRHDDLNLPHVPHMTTITSVIRPTTALTHWRDDHPERYPSRLSDFSPLPQLSPSPSCIRARKSWVVEHTLYISSRQGGTRPVHSHKPNPKEFHEMQWDFDYGRGGKLIEEREIGPTSPPDITADEDRISRREPKSRRRLTKRRKSTLLNRLSAPVAIARPLASRISLELKRHRKTWIANVPGFNVLVPSLDTLEKVVNHYEPLSYEYPIPNANFARKYALVTEEQMLPASPPLPMMPTAEAKAIDSILKSVEKGDREDVTEQAFKGPFTPQLGFDGGLDFSWTSNLRRAGSYRRLK